MKQAIASLAALTFCVAVPAAAQDWTGFYAGGSITSESFEVDAPIPIPFDFSGSDVGGAVFAGYSHVVANNIMLGIELSYSFAEPDLVVPFGPSSLSVVDTTIARLRAGFVAGNVLPYVTAGVARTTLRIEDSFGGPADTQDESGTSLGLGVEAMLSGNLALRGEYSRQTYDLDGADLNQDSLSVGLSWRF